jgi:hypothetical protein
VSPQRRVVAAFVIAAAVGPVVPAAASADTLVGTTNFPTHLSSYGGVTAWSETTTGKYQLVLSEKGKISHPKVDERTGGPFDVTLGPAEDGHTVALYSRCRSEDGTSGCDAYKYDLRSKKETRVEQISLTTRDEAWPAQWRHNYAFVRHNYGTGSNDLSDRCDKAFTRPTARELHIKTVSLTHGICGLVSGQAFRKTTLVQTVIDYGAPSNTALIRTQSISGGSPKVLAKHTSNQPTDMFDSPELDDKYIYATRVGTGPAPSFVRIRRDKNSVSEVEAQTTLAGSIAVDKGTLTYLAVQAATRGATCGPITPCRIVAASANPFSSSPRELLPRMAMAAPAEGLFGDQPLAVSGSLSVPTVKNGKIIGTRPLGGAPIEIWRAAYSSTPTGQTFIPTQGKSTTGGDGSWGLTVPPPVPVFGYYTAIAAGAAAAQAPIVTLHTFARIALDPSPRAVTAGGVVTFSGTVSPYQPGRAVDILQPLGEGATQNIAQALVNPDGTFSVKANVSSAGSFVAELAANPLDGADGNNTYTGRSPGVPITITP